MKNKKLDGIREESIELLFDDFINDINYFDDISLKRTIHFFTKNKDTDNYLSLIAGSLFVADNDDNSVLYFQKKTTIGFMLVSGYYNVFMKFLNNIGIFKKTIVDDIVDDEIPNKWSSKLILPSSVLYNDISYDVGKFVDENITIPDITRIYKEYFCLNYRTMKTKDITGIKCEEKKTIVEKQIYEELIIKLTYFIYYLIQIKNKNAIKIIINHYILNVFKSDRAEYYNISMVLGHKNYSNKDFSLYNSFTNIDVNNSFRVLKYLYQYIYNKKQFSTCGETTLLNILNYCLINSDGTFNTDKILNDDIIRFYEGKTMSQISEKGGRTIMTEWLDIVSNLKLPDIYNYAGDIHNNVKNVACVLNNLIYNRESCEIENPQQFIIDTIKYISNKPIDIKIENSTENSISMIVNNMYSLFFRPGHGEMNINIKKSSRTKIKTVELHDINSDEFDIVYSFYKKILTSYSDYGDKMDYDEAVSDIVITYFITHTDKKIVQLLLSTVKKLIINFHTIEFFGSKEIVVNFFDKIQNVTAIDFSVNEADSEIINVMFENIPKYLREFDIYTDELSNAFDLTPLSELKNLEAINLHNIISTHINAPNLKSFTYRGDIHHTDENISFITNYKKLEYVELNVPQTFDMNNLSKLVNLKSIRLFCQRKEGFFDFEIFKNLFNLEDLSVIDSNDNSEMKNTGVLKNTNLKSIYLDGFDITSYDLDIMFNLNHIEKIRFGEVNIKQDNILVIKNKNINKNLLDVLDKYTVNYKLNSDERKSSSSRKSSSRKLSSRKSSSRKSSSRKLSSSRKSSSRKSSSRKSSSRKSSR